MLQSFYKSKHFPAILAIIVALIITLIYSFSGQGSLDQGTRVLENNPKVEQVKIEQSDQGQKTANIKCRDGSEYDVYYPPGTTDFKSLENEKCSN